MSQQQIAALLLLRDRSMAALVALKTLIEKECNGDQSRATSALAYAESGTVALEQAVQSLTPP